tara:strand:- start:358 stop:1305 length:948 start_codon:yes stop_codon:yes gene_type:complete
MKKFIKHIVFLLLIPFVIFLLNLYVVIHYSPKFNKRFVQDLILNDSLSLKGNFSDRQLVKNRINIQTFFQRNIVIGSSRSISIGKPIDFSVDNYSMSGAIINDFESVYYYLKEKNIQIDTIFIEISPWIFNENIKETRFINFNSFDLKLRIKNLFSISHLKENLISKKYFPPKNSQDLIRYSDGTIKYDYGIRTQDNIKSMKGYIKKGKVYHLEEFNSIKKLNTNRLVKLIKRMIRDNSTPIFLKHPYPPLINSKIMSLYPNIKITDKLIDSIAKKFKIKSIGTFYPEELNIKNDDYYDGMHMKPNGIKKLFQIK